MSKIPVAKGGFRSYISKNNDKSTKSVLDEQKYTEKRDRIRNKENMSDDEEQSSSSLSMVNPQPTDDDYARFDADRRFRERARDARIAQRSATSSTRNTMSPLRMTPERVSSESSEHYFTPNRNSGGTLEEQFVTPETSKKERRRSERRTELSDSDSTPTARPPPPRNVSEHVYMNCLSRQMERNFHRMEELIMGGRTARQARHESLLEAADAVERSPRRAHRRTAEQMRSTILATRSSSQPPPIENLNVPAAPRVKSPDVEQSEEPPILRTSYVDAVVATHQLHMHYSDVTTSNVDKQMNKLESIRNLAALSDSPSEVKPKKRRLVAGSETGEFTDLERESDEQTAKKLIRIREVKHRVAQIIDIQMATHKLLSKAPFERNPEEDMLLNSIDHWMSLPFHEFDVQTSRQLVILKNKMMRTMKTFKQVTSMTERRHFNRSMSRRSSSVMKIDPSMDRSDDVYFPDLPPRLVYPSKKTQEASTQVTARLTRETAMTQTSPRKLGIERLDLDSVRSTPPTTDSSVQTTPRSERAAIVHPVFKVQSGRDAQVTPPVASVAPENYRSIETPKVPEPLDTPHPQEAQEVFSQLLPTSFAATRRTSEPRYPAPLRAPKTGSSLSSVAEIDEMLNNIVLKKDESLETVEAFNTEIHFPLRSPEDTPRSARQSLDHDAARRLSSGVAFYLKKYKREQEGSEQESESSSSEKIVINLTPPTDKSSSVGWSLADMEYSVYQNELNDETQYEHEKEEEELRKLREEEQTPTEEVKEEEVERPETPQPFTPREEVVEKPSETVQTTEDADESEGDETKKFVLQDEFEKTFEEEEPEANRNQIGLSTAPPSYEEAMNESAGADDSGFLLDNRPLPRLKSIFDAAPPPRPAPPVQSPPDAYKVPEHRSDTPRAPAEFPLADVVNDSTFKELDMEDYCQNEFLFDIAPIMIKKAIEFQNVLCGADWIAAQDIWEPPTFGDLKMDYYDHFDYFDSFAMLLWGGVVDLFNTKYAKLGHQLTEVQEKKFEEDVWEMLKNEHGADSKKKEWCEEVKLNKRLEGMVPFELEYRYDVRRSIPEEMKQKYKWQQLQMKVIAERYPRKKLEDELNTIYTNEKEKLARSILVKEIGESEESTSVSSEDPIVAARGSRDDALGVSDV